MALSLATIPLVGCSSLITRDLAYSSTLHVSADLHADVLAQCRPLRSDRQWFVLFGSLRVLPTEEAVIFPEKRNTYRVRDRKGALDWALSLVLAPFTSITSGTREIEDCGPAIVSRKTEADERERQLASIEKGLAEREKALADREAKALLKERTMLEQFSRTAETQRGLLRREAAVKAKERSAERRGERASITGGP